MNRRGFFLFVLLLAFSLQPSAFSLTNTASLCAEFDGAGVVRLTAGQLAYHTLVFYYATNLTGQPADWRSFHWVEPWSIDRRIVLGVPAPGPSLFFRTEQYQSTPFPP